MLPGTKEQSFPMVYYTLNKEILLCGKDWTSPHSSIPYTYKNFQTVKEPSSAHVSLTHYIQKLFLGIFAFRISPLTQYTQ